MLTDNLIRKAKPREKPYKLVDGQGLFLSVTPAGGKHWRMRYELAGGKEKVLSFGPYPSVSLLEARDERDAAKKLLRSGRDPAIDKQLLKATAAGNDNTRFEAVARTWHESKKSIWSEHYAGQVLRSLERDIFPTIGHLTITDLAPQLILSVLRLIEKRGAIEQAHRVRQRMSDVFVFAIASGLATTDPAAVVQPALKRVQRGRQPAITDLPALQAMLHRVEAEDAYPLTFLALRLLLLTALRPGEIRAARWDEFEGLDGPEPLWRVPAERMKMKREHLVALSRQAVETIDAVRPFTGRKKILFPNVRRPEVPMSLNALGYLMNRAGYLHRHVPHGFRASFSTIMNERFHQDRQVLDVMLAHLPKDRTEAAYNRALYLARRRELAQLWADLVTAGLKPLGQLVSGSRKASPSQVDLAKSDAQSRVLAEGWETTLS